MSINVVNSVNLAQPVIPESSVKDTAIDTNQWKDFEKSVAKISEGGVSMSELLALLAEIIKASKELRSQVMSNKITEAKATTELAVSLADDRKHDAIVKFGITLASSVVSMAITSASSVRMGQTKILKDKHLASMSGDSNMRVADLSAKDINKFSAQLQQGRTAKYNTVAQTGNMANSMVGNINDMRHAEEVKHQEEGTASKQLKEKVDAMLDGYLQDLTQAAVKLNEILDTMQRASLVTNR
ncbi:TPA: type III secretion system translocator protein VopD2 [Vibrio parahaemolyticus]|uniref:type III secretion system translocator protein VopD2 n=1 Tax=Vibrio parahaemolyticus TaxID=670 RepID=UPI0004145065|nr:type III secretion system translocator protein VopD2 [Vibrio parahaemolyticus]TNY56728.1 type III secretion system protein [Vibrio parahaemolyticus]TOZ94603.1 type III secretion system protein [Vibrio parahaemolyticus]TPA19057.1 type III secretion system protein [Vibrio parahaemolyticus]TPA45180.1 type III secretion system protein [Vibrio parahaemolyticus]TPA60990.1 type III secretion system protein [Vibrio parahaemolyticus]